MLFRAAGIASALALLKNCPQKNLGDALRVPRFVLGGKLVFLLASFLCLFLWCHGSILPSIIHGLCNAPLLQLFECIESMKNDVKRKMMMREHEKSTLKSQIKMVRKKKISFHRFSNSFSTSPVTNHRPSHTSRVD